jgi:hypothetical protein
MRNQKGRMCGRGKEEEKEVARKLGSGGEKQGIDSIVCTANGE